MLWIKFLWAFPRGLFAFKLMNDTIQKVIATLQTKVSGINFNNWIKPATFRLDEGEKNLEIEVPNKFIRDWITENYLHLIKYELFKITGNEHKIQFQIGEELPDPLESLTPSPETPLPLTEKIPPPRRFQSQIRFQKLCCREF